MKTETGMELDARACVHGVRMDGTSLYSYIGIGVSLSNGSNPIMTRQLLLLGYSFDLSDLELIANKMNR